MASAEDAETAAAAAARRIAVVVACSPAAGQVEQVTMILRSDATVWQAIEQSGLLQRYPALAGAEPKLGVWSQLRGPDDHLRDGDRVEIYRPLQIDPKEARRQRQQRARAGPPRG